MSNALWFYFWSADAATSSTSSTDVVVSNAGGGGSKADAFDYPINYDDLWAAREAYLRSLFNQPLKRQKAIEEQDWPDPILKPRRKRL